MSMPLINPAYLQSTLRRLLETPSPSGMTDAVVRLVCEMLDELGIAYQLTRRGAIRALLPGRQHCPKRAVASHLDTLGAMVKALKPNGRLALSPIGFWSSRFAEGERVTIYADFGNLRGTVLPLKASGHTFNKEIDTQPVDWTQVEVRLDERVASVLAAAEAVLRHGEPLPLDVLLLFTISEEVGVGASHVLHGGDVSELVSVDNGTVAEGQNTSEYGVTVSMMDSSGPFDWHLTRHLLHLCRSHAIDHARDVFRFYRSDAASAVEAGNDIRTALLCFACDASHGYERTHEDSLSALGRLLAAYMLSPPLFQRDVKALGPLGDFPPADCQLTPD